MDGQGGVMSETRTGRCACSQLTYEVRGNPIITHACHCSYCQRETGGAFAVNLLYEADRVTMMGEVEKTLTPSHSGRGQVIDRCPTCHVAVSSHYSAGEKTHFIRAGTLDNRNEVRPDVHIYISSDQPWLALADGAPQFEEFYNPREFWTDEQMARWKAAVA